MIVWDKLRDTILDGFVKSLAACPPCPSSARELTLVSARALGQAPSAALRCILSHCGVPVSTPHSFVFARLAAESFYFVV
jgi:hypothetical protein